jgi:Uncharacterized protein conserved in bacteria
MTTARELPPSLDDIAELAREAAASLPEPVKNHLTSVPIRVEEFCDAETETAMQLETAFDLLGLYRGVGLHRKSSWDVPQDVDMIMLYRRPILDYWCETGEPLSRIVRHILWHEVGHHLGFSDEDMARIEADE